MDQQNISSELNNIRSLLREIVDGQAKLMSRLDDIASDKESERGGALAGLSQSIRKKDWSSGEEDICKHKPKAIARIIERIKEGPGILYPDSPFRGFMHTLLTISAILEFSAITGASVICPGESIGMKIFYFILLLGSTLLLTIELLLNLNTAVHRNKWEIVDNLKAARSIYLRKWFWWDLFVTIPYDLILLAITRIDLVDSLCDHLFSSLFSGLCLIRLLHVVRIPTYYKRRNPLIDQPRWVDAVLFLTGSYLLIHSLALPWLLLASDKEQHIESSDSGVLRYTQSINWAFQSFVHGKSDAYAVYTATSIYSLLVKIFGFLIVATMEAKLAEFFVNHDPFHGLSRKRQQQLASLIIHNKVPWAVQKSVMAIYPSIMEANIRDYDIINDLPPFLAAQISKYIKIQLIAAVPMFSKTTEACRTALAECLEEELLPAMAPIVQRGDHATSMYFISNGMVEVWVPTPDGSERCLTTLKEGSWFGEIALLQDTTRTATIRSATAVKLFRLEKADFNLIASAFPELREHIEKEANKRMNALQPQEPKKDDDGGTTYRPSTATNGPEYPMPIEVGIVVSRDDHLINPNASRLTQLLTEFSLPGSVSNHHS